MVHILQSLWVKVQTMNFNYVLHCTHYAYCPFSPLFHDLLCILHPTLVNGGRPRRGAGGLEGFYYDNNYYYDAIPYIFFCYSKVVIMILIIIMIIAIETLIMIMLMMMLL